MKNSLILALCLGAASMLASAATITINSASMSADGSVTVNAANNVNTVDFNFSGNSGILGATHAFNLLPDNNGLPPDVGSFAILKIGSLTLENLEPSVDCVGVCGNLYGNMNITINGLTFNISTTAAPVTSTCFGTCNGGSGDTATVDPNGSATFFQAGSFWEYPNVINFGNGGQLSVWMYTGTQYGSWAPFTLGSNQSHDIYMKVWLNSESSSRVPEPASMALVGSGLIGLGVLSRRRARK